MSHYYIRLPNLDQQVRLDPNRAIIQLQESFPEAIVHPGDQLATSAQRAEQNLDGTKPADRAVLEKLWRDSRQAGPAYAFYIPPGERPRIDGVIKRFQADFHSEGAIPEALRTRIKTFLLSLIPPGAFADVCEESDEGSAAVSSR